MLKSTNLIGSFAQGFNIPQQYFREREQAKLGEVQRKQAEQNLLKSQLLAKYIPRQQEAALLAAQDAHKKSLMGLDPQKSRDAHMIALANIYRAMQPRQKGIQTGYDPQGRPTLSMGGTGGMPGTPPPQVLQQYLAQASGAQQPGMGQPQPGGVPTQQPPSLLPQSLMGGDQPQQQAAPIQQGITPPPGMDPSKTFSQNMMTGMGRGAQGKQFTTPTGHTFTPFSKINLDLWQGQNAAIDKLLPLLTKLKKTMTGKTTLGFATSPEARAIKEDIGSKAVEKILKAQGLTSTEKGIEIAQNQLEPFTGESNDAYIKRLENSISEYQRQRDQNVIKIKQAGTRTARTQKKITPRKEISEASTEELIRLAKGGA